MQVLRDLLSSKKAIVFLVTLIVDLVLALGVPMDAAAKTTVITTVTGLAAAFLVAQGIADAGKEKAKIEAKANGSTQPPA